MTIYNIFVSVVVGTLLLPSSFLLVIGCIFYFFNFFLYRFNFFIALHAKSNNHFKPSDFVSILNADPDLRIKMDAGPDPWAKGMRVHEDPDLIRTTGPQYIFAS